MCALMTCNKLTVWWVEYPFVWTQVMPSCTVQCTLG